MLTIRLSRIGKKKKPAYRLIISEKAKDPYGRVLEVLGSYNPFSKDLKVKADRIKYWLTKGSGMSPTINNLLIGKGIIEGKKVTASKPGKKQGEAASENKPAPAAEKTGESGSGKTEEKTADTVNEGKSAETK